MPATYSRRHLFKGAAFFGWQFQKDGIRIVR